jgi:L-ribulose-5-phosphate 3-epimerase
MSNPPTKSSVTTSADRSRRNFLLGAGAASLGVASNSVGFAHSPVEAPKPLPKRYWKAVKYGMVGGDLSVLQKFLLVKKLGFDGIELDSPNNLDKQEVLDARDQSGLPIHGVVDSLHWSKPFSHPDATVRKAAVQGLKTAIQDCKDYGGSTVLIVPAVVNKEVSYGKAWSRSRHEISKALPLAEELQIKLAIENVWNNFLLSPLELANYIDSFNSLNIGSYLDVGNLVRYAWPEHWVEALRHRIFKIDVKGYSRKLQNEKGPWRGFDVSIGDGDCDWATVMAALENESYEGWFTAEVGGGGEERLTEIAAAMDRIMSA